MLRKLAVFALVACIAALYLAMPASAMTFYGILDGYSSADVTASGDQFDPYGSTAASASLPMGTVVPACGPAGCEDVVINDRCACPDIDVTYGVAQRIGLI